MGVARHGHSNSDGGKQSPTYRSWASMIARCTQPSSAGFAHYQKLGITVCARWRVFDNFLADMGERPSRVYTLDRYPDQKGNYEPGNCRWATRREQANNRTTNKLFEFQGEMLTYREIARRTGLSDELLRHRLLRAGWSVERAVSSAQVPGKRPYETITDLATKAGVPTRVFAERLREGWSIERAGSPVRARGRS